MAEEKSLLEKIKMLGFLLWLILFVLCWPLALLALVLYPLIWILMLPLRLVGVTVQGILELLKGIITLPLHMFRLRGSKKSSDDE
jgi:hypothetical protein